MQGIRLVGKIETPIVTNWSNYRMHYKDKVINVAISKYDCKYNLSKPYSTYAIKKDYGKISRNNRPYIFNCYMGFVHLDFVGTEEDLKELLEINQLGKYKNEGMGKIEWLKWYNFEKDDFNKISINRPKKISLKKLNLKEIQETDYKFLTACLVHDLVRIKSKHPSKLFGFDLKIEDEEIGFIVYNHHNKIKHPLVKRLQKADQKAIMITRKKDREIKSSVYTPIRKGYNDEVNLQIFQKIKKEIEERLDNFPLLYEYIWNCKELDYLVEAQNYPDTSLRKHLLLTVQFSI